MEISLVPGTLNDACVRHRLQKTIQEADALRGCVAFWVIKPDYLGADFTDLLSRKESFYCIDIHYPTNIDNIDAFHKLGAKKLFLHLRKAGRTKEELKLPKHLLHAKIMLFDLPGGQAEIWIGSHNLTKRALNGINHEASTVIKCAKHSDFYNQVNAYLKDIKKNCSPYDPKLLEIYRSIQDDCNRIDDEATYLIPIIGIDTEQLRKKTLILLGDDVDDLQNLGLGKVNRKIIIQAFDLEKNEKKKIWLKASVLNTGKIVKSNPSSYSLEFSSQFYAIRTDNFFPFHSSNFKQIKPENLKQFAYWASISVEGLLSGVKLKHPSELKENRWEWVEEAQPKRSTLNANSKSWKAPEQPNEKTITYKAIIHPDGNPSAGQAKGIVDKLSLKHLINLSTEERGQILSYFMKRNEHLLVHQSKLHPPSTASKNDLAILGNNLCMCPDKLSSKKLGRRMYLVKTTKTK
ncbi:phospholipase D family protein [Pontibacter sp. CAU 1760]